ncbi:MAG TPA: FtsX-like permease family protein, partial [Bryobacteraceae bacterium]|nr:FtsX-like permease family protein [Bryobacteraceae bacterium]
GFSRRREIAIRLSIGAGKRRLLAQLLTESFLLGAAGGALGLGLAQVGAQVVIAAIPASQIGPHQLDLSPDWRILAYTLGLSLLTSLVFGLVPALTLLRLDLAPALKGALETTARGKRQRLQHTLVGVQVAVCLLLLVNAGLLLRGARQALHLDTGADLHHVFIVGLDLRQQQYSVEQAARFFTTLRDQVQALPGVQAAAVATTEPVVSQCGDHARAVLPDHTVTGDFRVLCDQVGPGYFRTMGIPLLQGRDFLPADYRPDARVIIVDEFLARHYFSGRNPLGQWIRGDDTPTHDRQIVGVVASTRELRVGEKPQPKVYTPIEGLRYLEARLLVRDRTADPALPRALERTVAALDPDLNARVHRIEENVETALAPVRFGAAAATTLGALGLLLACAGIYGVVSFMVGSRRREVGIRLALGAENADILRLILGQGMKPVLIGAVAGIALAAAGAQLIRVMLYGVSPIDPLAFCSMAALLALTALVAAWLPARSALRVDPAETLRAE